MQRRRARHRRERLARSQSANRKQLSEHHMLSLATSTTLIVITTTILISIIINLSQALAFSQATASAELISLANAFEHERQQVASPQYLSTPPTTYTTLHEPCLLRLNRTTSYGSFTNVGGWPSYLQVVGQPERQQQTVCITENDVSWALETARRQPTLSTTTGRVSFEDAITATPTSETPKPIQVIGLANLVTRASQLLVQRFQLSPAEILFELPSIDASKSAALAATCPAFLKSATSFSYPNSLSEQCFADDQPSDRRFRSLSGFCNNPRERSWGSARSAMVRFLAPDYQDSLSAPRVARDGSPLPAPRVVSFVVHQDQPECDQRHSLLGVVWGQFINHDINLGIRITDEDEHLKDLDCCKLQVSTGSTGAGLATSTATMPHPDCFAIEIPKGDPFYGYFNHKCMNFVRLAGALQPGCSLGPQQAMNKHSSYLDGSSIYGSSASTLIRLRTYRGGQLRSQPASMPASLPGIGSQPLVAAASASSSLDYDYSIAASSGTPLFKDLLPAQTVAPNVGCERRGRPKDLFCFDAGDLRANEQIQLASLHTIFMREHNRLAAGLAALNPHWSDERLFQEARAIVVGQLQHITYSEFLPLVLGQRQVRALGLGLEPVGRHFRGYDDTINPGVRVEFQSAAFRFGHSLVPGHIERHNKFHQPIESIRLSKLLKQPFDLYYPGVLDTYLLGMIDQRSGRMDSTLTTEVANHLFEKPGNLFGMDLAAINIQRAREMGVRGYNSYREFCGLPRARSFADLVGVFHNRTLLRIAQLYRHVDDIDLFTGGLAERPLLTAAQLDGLAATPLVGPTFACLIGRQFEVLRRGDRFWYENTGHFRLDQLDEIRRTSSARLLCDNSDDIEDIQAHAMLMAEPHTNTRVPCSSLPALDLSKWRELDAGSGATAAAAGPATALQDDNDLGASYKLQQAGAPAGQTLGLGSMPLDYEEQGEAVAAALQAPSGSTIGMSHFVNHLVDATSFRSTDLLATPGGSYLDKAAAARRASS